MHPERRQGSVPFPEMRYILGMSTKSDQSIVLGERGRMVLPAPVRQQLDPHAGDRLLVQVEDNGAIRLVTYRSTAEANRGLWRDVAPSRSLAAELIAERRAEAARESSSS